MGNYLQLYKKRNSVIFFTALFLLMSLAFNNCGQSGDLTILPPDANGSNIITNTDGDPQDPPSNNPPNNPPSDPPNPPNPPKPPVYNFVAKSKIVSVNALAQKKVDLLVVIDNSGSMANEQKNMAARFSSLIDQLEASSLDWQLAVVTTDVSSDANLKDGRLVPVVAGSTQYILDSNMDLTEAKAAFAKMIQRPEKGNGAEQGIKATIRAVQRALDSRSLSVNKPNRDFFRSDSSLAVLVVSDANETIKNGDPKVYAANNYGENLMNLVSNSYPGKNLVFNSIIVRSDDSSCLAKDGNESYGVAYEYLSAKTNGIVGTVCATDYAGQLKLIGQKVVEQVKSVSLECNPADSNGDGKVDIGVFEIKNVGMGGDLSAAVLGKEILGYSVQGSSIVFQEYLAEGHYEVKYMCKMAQ